MVTPVLAGSRTWDRRRKAKADRITAVSAFCDGKVVDGRRLRDVFEALLRRGDRVALEGDNQKQADFLSRTLAQCDPQRVHGLHILIGSVSRPEHLDLFENGIADKLDLAYAGPQSVRIAQLVDDGCLSFLSNRPVESDGVGDEAELGATLGEAVELGGLEQRFGRDAATHQAGAAEPVLLDDGCLRTKLRGAQGCDITTGSAAEDHNVERISHSSFLYVVSGMIMPGGSVKAWGERR